MDGSLDRTVTRGAESWQFFAFVFAAFVTLGLSLIDDLPMTAPQSIASKIACFLLCFEVFMRNAWVRNKLIGILGWIKTEHRGLV